MTTNRLLQALIAVTTGIFTLGFLVSQAYVLALLALAFGALWLVLEVREQQTSVGFFFLVFVGLAVLGSLQELAAPIMLLALCTNLAAWDLSRFLTRIKDETDSTTRTSLEKNHLRKLATALGAGFLIGLVPILISISINFVVLMAIILVAMLVLRQSVLALRGEPRLKDKA